MSTPQAQALLVLPHLRVQNANAISSPLTHGFPSITAFMGLMWALQRKLTQAQIPLRLLQVGVICHHHQEQTNPGYVRTFNLTRNPVDKNGSTAAIVEEGRMHLRLTLVFSIAMQPGAAPAGLYHPEQRAEWASQIGQILANMRVAGGTLLPSQPMPGQRVRPWLEPLADTAQQRAERLSPLAAAVAARLCAGGTRRCAGRSPATPATPATPARRPAGRHAAGCLAACRALQLPVCGERRQGTVGRPAARQRQWLAGAHSRGLCRAHASP